MPTQMQEIAQDFYESLDDDEKDDPSTYELEKQIEDLIDEMNPLISEASLFSDMLGAAFDEVNWREIAENWIETIKENM